MKMRKLLSGALAAALALTLATPALAVDATADARLSRVLLAVKTTLGVGDEYGQFHGEPSDGGLGTRWALEWSGGDGDLRVSATDAGKVLEYRLSETYSSSSSGGSFQPKFPDMSRADAQTIAQTFLDKVLTDGEAAVFDGESGQSAVSAESYGFSGAVQLNGLPTPMDFSLRVSVGSGAVTWFTRGDESDYVGGVTAPPSASGDAAAAAGLLKGTLKLRLEYVLPGEGKQAVLRYLPEGTDKYYVDAATGALVDLTELERQIARKSSPTGSYANLAGGAAAGADAGTAPTPSPAEQAGVKELEGVLDEAALEKQIRAYGQLGLTAYTYTGSRYAVDRETGGVSAALTFAKKEGEDVYRRIVTVDGKTGALESVYSSAPYDQDRAVVVGADAAQTKAEDFLKALWGEQFAGTGQYDRTAAATGDSAHSFVYAQKVNGYFFPDNALSVRVDAADGSISGLSKRFDDAVTFQSADGILSADAALDAWFGSFTAPLAYIEVPQKLDLNDPLVRPLIDSGLSYYYGLNTGYALERRGDRYLGVDAGTGELVKADEPADAAPVYSDLDGYWGKAQLEELASYGVGWTGGEARPAAKLTQVDLIALMASAEGYGGATSDDLYDYAYSRGILTRDRRSDDKVLTRGETVRLLLDGMGYTEAANLKDIYRCAFTDADAIPAELVGYAALAQGLGLVKGDGAGGFAADREMTRGEAAVMLWQYMKR